ncbi:MAG TPA: DUF6789 family protein [Terracidiphilus sp.]|nr:DUF6789 family protein [Terracidiphilus sp.]
MNGMSVKLVLGGVAGTAAMTLMMLIAPMMGVHMDITASLAGMVHAPWMVGMVVHLMMGILIFPLVYGILLRRYLPGSALVRGLIWGSILWMMMEVVVMPMLGAGVFGIYGPGMMGAVAALMAHLVYGGLLGVIAAGEATPELPKLARV